MIIGDYVSRGLSGRGLKLFTHLHLMLKIKKEWSRTSTFPVSRYDAASAVSLFNEAVGIYTR
jgi:hypothetical protein